MNSNSNFEPTPDIVAQKGGQADREGRGRAWVEITSFQALQDIFGLEWNCACDREKDSTQKGR